ncbi:hypothetical protein DY000_02015701 [Brassica cretica]|uniref:Uncharacterized protein n=1 Tax=Brassica cretica TaxID=69181 RepID=A0ABQ7CQ96_BRACR|nr:hypothetical protein DY000_02015701 [Brassica cretica]
MEVFDEAEGSGNIYRQGQKFTGRTEIRPMDREARGGSLHGFRTWWQPYNKLSVSRSSRCHREWKQYMKPDILTSRRSGGVLHVSWTCSQPCGARAPREGSVQLKVNQVKISSDGNQVNVVREGERNEVIDLESPREGSVQLKVNQVKISSDGNQVNVVREGERNEVIDLEWQSGPLMIKCRCCPDLVQFHGFRTVEVLHDTPPGSPKNCPGAKGGSVQINPSRPVSFYMVKPRFCPSRDQSSSVQSSRPLGFGLVFSDQPAASRLEHYELACVNSTWNLGFLLSLKIVSQHEAELSGALRETGSWPMAEWLHDGVVTGSDLNDIAEDDEEEHKVTISRVIVWCWVLTLSPKSGLGTRLGLVFIWFPLLEARSWQEAKSNLVTVLTLSPKSGLGTRLGLVFIWFPLLEARLWQEAKSNLVTVALGKYDRIAWCWTLGPPV